MDKILLLMMLNGDITQQDEDKRKAEEYKSIPMPAPVPAEPTVRICIKTGNNKECKELTQAEISSGAVRGNKIIDEGQP